jgi:drug/metabolite transporter (DMT)-like permease
MQFGPIVRMTASIAVLSFMDAVIKGMAVHYPVFQVAFLRFLCGSIIAVGVACVLRPGWPSRETVVANSMRAVVAVLTALSFFYALSQLPLAETLLLSFLAPMFIALLGVIMLKERVDGRILAALAMGFAGTLVVVFGQSGEEAASRSLPGVAAALASALTYALSIVLLRSRAQRDKFMHIVLFQNLGPMVLSLPLALWVWQPLDPGHLAWFALMGALGFAGHMLMVSAYAKAPAARLAPLEYTALIWAALIGFGVFAEVPTWATLAGGVLIVAAAVVTSRR